MISATVDFEKMSSERVQDDGEEAMDGRAHERGVLSLEKDTGHTVDY